MSIIRHLRWIHKALMALAVLAGIVMMLHVTADVLSRGVLRHSLPAVGEITASYYMIIVAFMPLAYVSYKDTHIRADLFTRFLPEAGRRWLAVGVDLLTVAYLALIGWQGVVSALKRTNAGEVVQIPGGFLPIWPARWLVPIAIFAMILATLLRLAESLVQERHRHDAPQEA